MRRWWPFWVSVKYHLGTVDAVHMGGLVVLVHSSMWWSHKVLQYGVARGVMKLDWWAAASHCQEAVTWYATDRGIQRSVSVIAYWTVCISDAEFGDFGYYGYWWLWLLMVVTSKHQRTLCRCVGRHYVAIAEYGYWPDIYYGVEMPLEDVGWRANVGMSGMPSNYDYSGLLLG